MNKNNNNNNKYYEISLNFQNSRKLVSTRFLSFQYLLLFPKK